MLKIQDIHYAYNQTEVLKGITHEFKNGALTILLGPNGSGKSTLLKVLGGEKPSQGTATLDEKPIHTYNPKTLARRLAFLMQNQNISFDFKVEDIVLMGRNPYINFLSTETEEDKQKAKAAMAATNTLELAGRSIFTLSGGERQRVFLARAIAQESDYLLLDEPITGLDIKHQLEFMQLLKMHCQTRCKTVLCVLHDLELAARFADELLLLHNGRIYAKGAPDTVLTPKALRDVYGINGRLFMQEGQPFISLYQPNL